MLRDPLLGYGYSFIAGCMMLHAFPQLSFVLTLRSVGFLFALFPKANIAYQNDWRT